MLYYYDDQAKMRVRLGDYGFVANCLKKKEEEVWEGDGVYMAPELLNDFQGMDLRKCDIYSLGVSLIELFLSNSNQL